MFITVTVVTWTQSGRTGRLPIAGKGWRIRLSQPPVARQPVDVRGQVRPCLVGPCRAQAEPLYKRSLAIVEKALGPDHPDVAIDLNNLALLYRAMNRDDEAEPLEQRAARIEAIER